MEEFLKPADLFKKRRVSGATSLASKSLVNSSIKDANNKVLSPSVPTFMSGNMIANKIAQSPMKCLSNLTDPSPTKKLPVVLKNPFNQPVKRRLQLGNSPTKKLTSSTNSSPRKSPVKKSCRTFDMTDEDANLEPPKKRNYMSPTKRQQTHKAVCYKNDWTLRTKLSVNFNRFRCRNWSQSSTTTHKRYSGNLMDEETPSKINDKTISLEAIKNAATVYQHPYLPWLPLFPRIVFDKTGAIPDKDRKLTQFAMSKHPAATSAMFSAWCESLDDLTNLLIDGKCPFFYICSDVQNMLFKRSTSYHDVQAFITPFEFNFAMSLEKHGIKYRSDIRGEIDDNNENSDNCNSQPKVFGNIDTNTMIDSNAHFDRSNFFNSRIDSDLDDKPYATIDDELGLEKEDDNELTSQDYLDSLGVNLNDERTKIRPVPIVVTNHASKSSGTSRTIGLIEGVENIRKFIQMLKSNKKHTIHNSGEHASLPATLLSPREFRLSTPQYPDVIISKGTDSRLKSSMADSIVGTPNSSITGATASSSPTDDIQSITSDNSCNKYSSNVRARVLTQSSTFDEGIQDDLSLTSSIATGNEASMVSILKSDSQQGTVEGPRSFELRGPILPNLYKKLHKLLVVSDNRDHICSANQLNSSLPFEKLRFN